MTRTVRYLNRAAVEQLRLPMQRIVDEVEFGLSEKAHGRALMPAKHWMETPGRWFGGMSSVVPATGYAAMKWQTGSVTNPSRGLPYITGMLFLNDMEEGVVVAVMDSTWLTQQRTAAASAVTARYLAKPGADSFAMLGCGVQARSHLEALPLVLPSLRRVVAYDIDPAAARRFAAEVERRGFEAQVVGSARAAVEAADVVVSSGPIAPNQPRPIQPDWMAVGALGITLDYDCYWSAAAFEAVDLLVSDDIGQLEHIRADGYFTDCPAPDTEVGQVVIGDHPGRTGDAGRILALNMGVSVEDVATARAIFELAVERDAGQLLPL
jgi:ornithine cyclodeaminase/alanine dehydrogenase-like protein (mu-crystallin family)